jgi:uncharacterized protein
MKINTEHIKESVREFSFCEPPEYFPVLAEVVAKGYCSFNGSVQVSIRAVKEFDHYRVQGNVTVPVQLNCSRCLSGFDYLISSDFVIFFREGSVAFEDEDEVELGELDLVSSVFSGNEIDLMPEISEQIILDIPIKPLCSETCKGLCPSCGSDLNKTTCNCVIEPRQSRFSVLKDLKVS